MRIDYKHINSKNYFEIYCIIMLGLRADVFSLQEVEEFSEYLLHKNLEEKYIHLEILSKNYENKEQIINIIMDGLNISGYHCHPKPGYLLYILFNTYGNCKIEHTAHLFYSLNIIKNNSNVSNIELIFFNKIIDDYELYKIGVEIDLVRLQNLIDIFLKQYDCYNIKNFKGWGEINNNINNNLYKIYNNFIK